MLGVSYFTCVFRMVRPFVWYHDLDPLTFELGVWPTFKNFNFGHTIWLVGARGFIFHMCIPSSKTFHLIPWPWPTDIWPSFRKFYLVVNTCKTFFECFASLKFLWYKRDSANSETFGGALSDFVSLLVTLDLRKCHDLVPRLKVKVTTYTDYRIGK